MDPNKTGAADLTGLAPDELIEEYEKLLGRYQQLKTFSENDQQKIYELRRSWETASSAEAYLSQELEVAGAAQAAEIEKIQQQHQTEIDDLKRKYLNMTSQNACLEQKVEEFREEGEALRKKVNELENAVPPEKATTSSGSMERELTLAKENLELLAKVDHCQEKVTASIMSIAERDRQIEIFKEQVECLNENLQAKRDEIEEKIVHVESAQERMMEMSAELALLKAMPDNANRKGNSLFAEVDDQRQEMKKVLAAQKKHYLQMKKSYNESEQEIRRLKRENAAMYKEMQVCTTIFLSADKLYKEKLNERILQLLKQNSELEKKLMWTQEKLVQLSNDKGINWLDSMLAFCKSETEEIKNQLRSCRLQKGILEENLRNSQQELAKWRFEALKSRCVIISRETLLEENNITFQPITAYDCNITEKQCNTAKPKILFGSNDSSPEVTIKNEALVTPSPVRSIETTANIKTELDNTAQNISDANLTTTPISSRYNPKFEVTNSVNQSVSNEMEFTIEHDSFDINDDTNQIIATAKSLATAEITHKINFYKNTPFKKQEPLEDVSDSGCSSVSFEIYEDTTCRIPVVRAGLENSNLKNQITVLSDSRPDMKSCTDGSLNVLVKDEEYKSPLSSSKPVLTENIQPQSILVKNRNMFNDIEDKAVTFSPELTEIKDDCRESENIDAKPTRLKSNVVVKRIVIKSNFNKK